MRCNIINFIQQVAILYSRMSTLKTLIYSGAFINLRSSYAEEAKGCTKGHSCTIWLLIGELSHLNACYHLPNACYNLPHACYNLPNACYNLPTADYMNRSLGKCIFKPVTYNMPCVLYVAYIHHLSFWFRLLRVTDGHWYLQIVFKVITYRVLKFVGTSSFCNIN